MLVFRICLGWIVSKMEELTKLGKLLELAEQIGITIRRAPGAGLDSERPGGSLVRLRDSEMLFLDPTASTADQVAVVTNALRGRAELKDKFIPPGLGLQDQPFA